MITYLDEKGSQTYTGTAQSYDQVDYAGKLTDYTFTLNDDGTVTVSHPVYGTDTLNSIDGFWFYGEEKWYSLEDALAIAGDVYGTVDDNGAIVGNAQDNVLIGDKGEDVFYGGLGDDFIDGSGNAYDQADYDGSLREYSFTRNLDGSVTVTHPTYGTDTLVDIDGLWFDGDQSWYSIEQAIALTAHNTPGNTDEFTVSDYGVLIGTVSDDIMSVSDTATSLYGGLGNDRFIGDPEAYSQVDYDGAASEYSFTANADGSITVSHPIWGMDVLTDIDGIWFSGEENWYALSDLVDATPPANPDPVDPDPVDPDPADNNTGVLVDGVITGSNAMDDVLIGDAGDNAFAAGMGVDQIDGGAGRDVLNVDGDLIEWNISRVDANTIVMTHPTWGENTLTDVELIFFGREGRAYTIEDAINLTEDLPEFRLDNDNVLNGTNLDDVMTGATTGTNFYGGVGDDTYLGSADAFDQVNYDGVRSQYTITQNQDGSFNVDHPIWGTDTLVNIDAVIFTGAEPGIGGEVLGPFEFVDIADLSVA